MSDNISDRVQSQSSSSSSSSVDGWHSSSERTRDKSLPVEQSAQNFGNLTVRGSSGIHIGHNITYNAPVNITTRHAYSVDDDDDKTLRVDEAVNASDEKIDTFNPTSLVLQFVQRDEWKAERARDPPEPLSIRPAIFVIISHTVTQSCFDRATCSRLVLNCQEHHKYTNGWSDIGYNFLVGGDGLVYVGRGWGVQGAHAGPSYNRCSIGISLLGNFNEARPSSSQLSATLGLIRYGLEHGHITRNYTLLGHRQCRDTLSPGNAAYNIIKSWPRWSPVAPPPPP